MNERTELLICHTVGCQGPLMWAPWQPMWLARLAMRICGWASDRVNA